MAVEGPQIRDGSCVAAANYSNTATLAGSQGSGQFLLGAYSQAANRTVLLASAAGAACNGVIQNQPASGQAVDFCVFGLTKAMVGTGGTTRGKPQMVTAAGAITDWTAGSGYSQIGTALESGVAGVVVEILFTGSNDKVLT